MTFKVNIMIFLLLTLAKCVSSIGRHILIKDEFVNAIVAIPSRYSVRCVGYVVMAIWQCYL